MTQPIAFLNVFPPPGVGSAAETDPKRNGVMRGFPPPREKRVQFNDGTAITFPGLRWSLNHWREVAPTKQVWRGAGPVVELPKTELNLDDIAFETTDGRRVTFPEAVDLNYTDGLLILHRGKIIYETYRGEGDPQRPHCAFSITKS